MRQAFVTIDLGFGDAGKGAAVDALCRQHNADLVVRYSGGAQAGHNVELPNGTRHKFSQFGAGYFSGTNTFLGPAMIIKPCGIRNEAKALVRILSANPYERLRVHPDCLVATPYHQAMNRIREYNRSQRHGSCGLGIGEARSYWLAHGSDAVFASDLRDVRLLEKKLSLMRQRFWNEVLEHHRRVLPDDNFSEWPAKFVATDLSVNGSPLEVDPELPEHSSVVYEAAQGVLLDESVGFPPHTTWSTVTTHHAVELLDTTRYDQVTTLGITRAYTSRHGAGPLPTFSPQLTECANDIGNPENPWQGKIRMGWLDLTLLRYAIAKCGSKLDGLIVNHLDHVRQRALYSPDYLENDFFMPDLPTLESQQTLNRILERAVPRFVETTCDGLLRVLSELVPVYVTADGPTHLHRKWNH